jgi:hypothetical protein
MVGLPCLVSLVSVFVISLRLTVKLKHLHLAWQFDVFLKKIQRKIAGKRVDCVRVLRCSICVVFRFSECDCQRFMHCFIERRADDLIYNRDKFEYFKRIILLVIHGPASWCSGQSFWLLIMSSRVRFPFLSSGFFLEGEDSRGDHGLGSLVALRFKAPPDTS